MFLMFLLQVYNLIQRPKHVLLCNFLESLYGNPCISHPEQSVMTSILGCQLQPLLQTTMNSGAQLETEGHHVAERPQFTLHTQLGTTTMYHIHTHSGSMMFMYRWQMLGISGSNTPVCRPGAKSAQLHCNCTSSSAFQQQFIMDEVCPAPVHWHSPILLLNATALPATWRFLSYDGHNKAWLSGEQEQQPPPVLC